MPDDDVSSFRRGVDLLKSGRLEDAIRELEHAATTGEDLPVEHFALAVAYEKSKQAAAALDEYRRFLAMDPKDESKLAYARKHVAKLEARVAGTVPTTAPSAAPAPPPSAPPSTASAADATLRHAEDALASGDVSGALAHLKSAVAAEPASAAAWCLLGKAEFLRGLGDARAALERAVALDPRSARAYFNLGVIAQLQHDTARAREAFHAAAEIDPGDGEAAAMLAQLPEA